MSSIKKHKFILVLMPVEILCLASCVRTSYNHCPTYPIAGAKVAAELEQHDYHSHKNTWEWLGRIDKLRQELELCR